MDPKGRMCSHVPQLSPNLVSSIWSGIRNSETLPLHGAIPDLCNHTRMPPCIPARIQETRPKNRSPLQISHACPQQSHELPPTSPGGLVEERFARRPPGFLLICPGVQQQLEDRRRAQSECDTQGCAAVASAGLIQVSACLQQEAYDRHPAVAACDAQRSGTCAVDPALVRIGPDFQEQAHHVDVAPACSYAKGRRAVASAGLVLVCTWRPRARGVEVELSAHLQLQLRLPVTHL